MGSVQSNIECPICKSENCIEDYYYKSDEIYILCLECGYRKEIFMKTDEKGNYLKDENGNYIYETIEEKGKGIVKLAQKNSCGQAIYTIPYNEKERKGFLDDLKKWGKENPDVDIDIKHYEEKLCKTKNL